MKSSMLVLLFGLSLAAHSQPHKTTITNFQTRFDVAGEAIDAHDGEIAFFKDKYYLYGTSYGCGFEWGNKGAPFCGFKVYESTDLVHWTDKGALFDASTPVWQSRCNGATYGCFRPHVVYNKKTKLYVLWINVYDNSVGFRVFTSPRPEGPFTEVANPRLAVNTDSAVAGLNNGDHDTFVDEDGTGYLAYTDWRTNGTIVIEKLSPDYLSGTGEHVKAVTAGRTEAPSLFCRKGIYYVTYSDPNCGYCSGTGTSYKTAPSPLGPWSAGKKISDSSCGGQPSFVSVIRLTNNTMYLYGSDLWNNAAKNEALANYYWAPLNFAADGSIRPMQCQQKVTVTLAKGEAGRQLDGKAIAEGFIAVCDISGSNQPAQTFAATHSGILKKVIFSTLKSGYPDAGLEVLITDMKGVILSSTMIPADSISWSSKNMIVLPDVAVAGGKTYKMILKSAATKGCFGAAYKKGSSKDDKADNGFRYKQQSNSVFKYEIFIN
jgi:Glycosyl hydrolases family 43